MNILLAEDECVTRECARITLEGEGFKVVAVADGIKALEMARNRPFDVVLLDMKMPGMDGMEVARRIRNDESLSARTKIIALTALSSDQIPQTSFSDIDAHLEKPFAHHELIRTIQSCGA